MRGTYSVIIKCIWHFLYFNKKHFYVCQLILECVQNCIDIQMKIKSQLYLQTFWMTVLGYILLAVLFSCQEWRQKIFQKWWYFHRIDITIHNSYHKRRVKFYNWWMNRCSNIRCIYCWQGICIEFVSYNCGYLYWLERILEWRVAERDLPHHQVAPLRLGEGGALLRSLGTGLALRVSWDYRDYKYADI